MSYLVILVKVDKKSEIYFYYTILIFSLFINLKIKSNKNLTIDFNKVIK